MTHLDRADQTEAEADGAAMRAANLKAKIARIRERRRTHATMLADLVASGESQISLTDPDARGMATHPKISVGYNAQVAVNAKHKLIVEQHATNAGSGLGLLAQTAGAARELLGVERIDAVADKGYCKGEDIAACEEVGVIPYVARPQRGVAVAAGRFAKDEFVYDAAGGFSRCPAGHRLDPVQRLEKNGRGSTFYSNRPACRGCPLKPQCTAGSARRIERWEGEAVLGRMARRLAARPDILATRREAVEHPFGSIKQWMDQGAFLMKGLPKVRSEFSLTAFAYNLRRVTTIVGVPAMMMVAYA